jgi:hypothetical protein
VFAFLTFYTIAADFVSFAVARRLREVILSFWASQRPSAGLFRLEKRKFHARGLAVCLYVCMVFCNRPETVYPVQWTFLAKLFCFFVSSEVTTLRLILPDNSIGSRLVSDDHVLGAESAGRRASGTYHPRMVRASRGTGMYVPPRDHD